MYNTPPLSLYIHIPWCIKKCYYCDFNSHLSKNLPENEYIDAIILDLQQSLPLIWQKTVNSIYIGGGTPSLFTDKSIDKLLATVRALVPISPFAEITLEANPGALSYISGYKQAGINRISLGVQSFNNEQLKTLGRIHNTKDAFTAIENIKKHFDNFNIDIMYGLPHQTLNDVKYDIEMASKYTPPHLSLYHLTIEPNTYFYKNVPKNLPDNDLGYEMQECIKLCLMNVGYKQYEIAAFSFNKMESKHNLNYWQFGDYLGIGAGAHSKLTVNNVITRYIREKNPQLYMKAIHSSKQPEIISVDKSDVFGEFMMNSMRLTNGIPIAFLSCAGLTLQDVLPKLLIAEDQNLLNITATHIVPTEHGQNFLNDLLMIFL